MLVYVHLEFSRNPSSCLNHLRDEWPRNGVLRVEIVSREDKQQQLQYASCPSNLPPPSPPQKTMIIPPERQQLSTNNVTLFDLKYILTNGPRTLIQLGIIPMKSTVIGIGSATEYIDDNVVEIATAAGDEDDENGNNVFIF